MKDELRGDTTTATLLNQRPLNEAAPGAIRNMSQSQPNKDQATSTHLSSDSVLKQLVANESAAIDRLIEFLRIPSVSTDPAFGPECRKAGQWVIDQLAELGFTDTRLRGSETHPVAFGHHPGPDGYTGPHILFYGHYDVQPPDPLDLWNSPPFEPVVIEGQHGPRIVARGAVDDKGQVMTFIEAMRAWRDVTGEIPCRVTCLIEGEEEAGSEVISAFLDDAKDELIGESSNSSPCDFVLISDTGMWDIQTPAITAALRGLLYTEITLRGPALDLHSGGYGGAVPNPINELATIISQLHDENRMVTLPGFYDKVRTLTKTRRADLVAMQFDEKSYLGHAGFEEGYGERGFTTLERQWCRPTCDVNGISGGYEGEGAKTVIASHASAKISFRLVADQDPDEIYEVLGKWLEERTPPGCTIEMINHGTGLAYEVTDGWPILDVACESLKEVAGKEAVLAGCGGSIPIVESFKRVLGLDSLLVGFGLEDDCVHSPNEKFEIACFNTGMRSHAIMLGKFASM